MTDNPYPTKIKLHIIWLKEMLPLLNKKLSLYLICFIATGQYLWNILPFYFLLVGWSKGVRFYGEVTKEFVCFPHCLSVQRVLFLFFFQNSKSQNQIHWGSWSIVIIVCKQLNNKKTNFDSIQCKKKISRKTVNTILASGF